MPWKLGNIVIREGSSWVDNNKIRHPSNWAIWSDAYKKEKGLTWEDPSLQDAPFDSKFYDGRKVNGDLIEKSLDDRLWVDDDGLKKTWKARTKQHGYNLLAKTDWYVTRKAEAGTAIPSDIATYRTDVRTATKTIEDKIDACDTFAKFKALFDTPMDSDLNPTGNSPMYDYPDEVS